MNIHINTPEGTRDRLFSECLERRQVQSALVELFRRRGYTEVSTGWPFKRSWNIFFIARWMSYL